MLRERLVCRRIVAEDCGFPAATTAQMLLQLTAAFRYMRTIRGDRASYRGFGFGLIFFVALAARAERINQEGRILGPSPTITSPILFNTPQADSVVSALQI